MPKFKLTIKGKQLPKGPLTMDLRGPGQTDGNGAGYPDNAKRRISVPRKNRMSKFGNKSNY